MAKLKVLIDRVTERLSQVSGTGVQIYAEDRIGEMIQHKFDILFDDLYWPQFTTWETFTLDGTLGVVTDDITSKIKRYDDIRVVYPAGTSFGLPELPAKTLNPNRLLGVTPLYIEANGANAGKIFNIWPKTATGDVDVNYRTKPDDFGPDDNIDFDSQALILGATFDYLEDDGTNPGATAKFEGMFESRRRQLRTLRQQQPIPLNPTSLLPRTITITKLP